MGRIARLAPILFSGSGNRDPNWSSVTLLLGNDSKANGTASFTDQSSAACAMTTVGSARYDGSKAPAGLSSSILLAANTDYITTPAAAGFNPVAGNFTLEMMFLCPATIPVFATLFDTGTQAFAAGFGSPSTSLIFVLNATTILTSAHTMTSGNWYHLAWVRSGNSQYIFQNGAQIGGTGASSLTVNSSGTVFTGQYSVTQTFSPTSNIAALRFTKGVARYTSTFTPPALPLPTR